MRRLAVAFALGFLAAPLAIEAQQPAKVHRIGILGMSAEASHLMDAFLESLRKLGYVEGKNLVIERRYSEGKDERLPDLAAELVGLKLDVIVATGGQPPYAAKRATSTIPIVFTNNGDPVGTGLVTSLARPGGNVTGFSLVSAEITGKRLELLKEAVPRISRLAVLKNPGNPIHRLALKEAEIATGSLGLRLHTLEARVPSELAGAFLAATKERAEALIVLGDPMFSRERTRISELAAGSRLPVMAAQREFVEAGSLMAYGASIPDAYRRAAIYVDKILKGAKPADLPVEQPTKFELVVNLKTAKALGLAIPASVLARADEVIR